MTLSTLWLSCLLGACLPLPAAVGAAAAPSLSGGVIAVWLNGPGMDRDAILKLPLVKDGQVMVQWAQVEQERGKYDFSALDAQLADYSARGLPVTIQLNGNQKPHYLFNIVPFVKEGAREVPAFRQVSNPEGTLMYWHPAHEKAYLDCLAALCAGTSSSFAAACRCSSAAQ